VVPKYTLLTPSTSTSIAVQNQSSVGMYTLGGNRGRSHKESALVDPACMQVLADEGKSAFAPGSCCLFCKLTRKVAEEEP
jgi:hypothetical protein